MPVISITITPSTTEATPGIPDTITLSANIPATIFYTLDGTAPDVNAAVYTLPISLPQYLPQVVLTIFATNGTDSSAVITETYAAILSQIETAVGDRLPQSTVSNLNNANQVDQFPFGSNDSQSNFNYVGVNADNTVLNQNLPTTPTQFDANGNPTSFISQPLNPFGSPQTNINFNGQVDPGGGTKIPVEVIGKNSPVEYEPEFSSKSDRMFNAKALVIFQDLTDPNFQGNPIVMRPHFSMENQEITKDGAQLAIPIDVATYTGTFIRSSYNALDHTLTTYYRDSTTNRWIINKAPHSPTQPNFNSLSNIVLPNGGSGADMRVFKWLYFQQRTLPG